MNSFPNNDNITIVTTISRNINYNSNQIIPGYNCPKCTENRNK